MKVEDADSFQLRQGLLDAISENDDDDTDGRIMPHIIVDITGSLGLWGIKH